MRENDLEGYVSVEEEPIEPRFGIHDRGLTRRLQQVEQETSSGGFFSRIKKAVKYTALAGFLVAAGLVGAWYHNTDHQERAEHCRQARAIASQVYEKLENTAKGLVNLLENHLGPAVDGKYDNHNLFCEDPLDQIIEPVFAITNNSEYEVVDYTYDKKGKTKKTIRKERCSGWGTGIVIHNDKERLKILTCEHVLSAPEEKKFYQGKRLVREIRNVKTTYGLRLFSKNLPLAMPPFFGVMKHDFTIELDKITGDKKKDVALLETRLLNKGLVKYIRPFTNWGNSEELEPGDFLYFVGFPYDLPKHLGTGRAATKPENFVCIYADANPGNSGGPAYALRDGKPELVGLMRGTKHQGLSQMVGVDVVKRFLDKNNLGFVYKGGKDES